MVYSKGKGRGSGKVQVTKNVKKFVKKAIKSSMHAELEFKHLDKIVTGANSNYTLPLAYPLTDCSPGTGDQQRIGDKINIKGVHVKLNVEILRDKVTLSNNNNASIRLCLVQNNSYAITNALVLNEIWIPGPTTYIDVMSQRNVDHLETYTVLYDKVYNFSYLSDAHKTLDFKANMKYAKRHIQFSNAATDNVTGRVFLVIMSDSISSTTATMPLMSFESRVLFTDS